MASNINPSLTPTNNLANFRFWCQKVLPLVYDDSLSYYEVLGKMVVQLNDVIDNVNADSENVLTLKDAFLELQTYVNNFFDDIDQLSSYAERAETAQTAANQSAINAASSASNASASSIAAMNARDAAVAARQSAETSANTASTAATNANTKASEAAQSAITAQTAQANASQSATLAATDRSAAQTAASTATTKANEASTSATNAETSATNAAQSEADAEELVDNIQENLNNIQQNTNDISDLKESINNIEPWKAWTSKYLANNGSVSGANVSASFKENSVKIETSQSTTVGRMIVLSNTPRVYVGTQGNFNPLESDLLPIKILESEYIKISSFIKSEDTETTDRYCIIGIRTYIKNNDDSFTPLDSLNIVSTNTKPNALLKPFIGKISSEATHFLVGIFFSAGIRVRSQEIVYAIEPFDMDAITAATQALVLENIGG